MMMARNAGIDMAKFVFCLVIVFYHFFGGGVFPGGVYGVEFFMLCAGLYLFRSFEYKPQTPGAYLKRRFWRFFPWIAVAFVVSFCIKNFLLSPVASVEELYERASKSVWELLMVEMNGLNGDQFPINVASWTVSTMLIVGTVIWGCLYYYGEKFRDFFMPVSILVLLGVWVHFENLSNSKWHVLFTAGMVRTWIEMCLGYYCLRLSELITVKDNPRVRKIALALIESLGYGLVLLSIYNGATRWHQLMTLLLMIPVVAITASGQSAWQDFFAWLTRG